MCIEAHLTAPCKMMATILFQTPVHSCALEYHIVTGNSKRPHKTYYYVTCIYI